LRRRTSRGPGRHPTKIGVPGPHNGRKQSRGDESKVGQSERDACNQEVRSGCSRGAARPAGRWCVIVIVHGGGSSATFQSRSSTILNQPPRPSEAHGNVDRGANWHPSRSTGGVGYNIVLAFWAVVLFDLHYFLGAVVASPLGRVL